MEPSTSSYYLEINDLNSLNTTETFQAELNVPYAACEILVAVCAVLGNGLVITVFSKNKKLRRRTNYYIISLATADLLVGLFAIPFAILASIGLPRNLYACLFTVSVLIVLCTISIFCLVAVSIDRYWAILYPMGYSRNVRTKTAIGIICICWIAGILVGFLPLLGWNAGHKSADKCIFVEVMDYNYLVFLFSATIIFPALLIAAFYAHIYRVVLNQMQQITTMNPGKRSKKNQTTGTMLRLLGAAQKREVKVTQNLSRIVIFFIICWFPLYTINCIKAFCPNCEVGEFLLNFSIILSHFNSVGNPLLYAYHLKDFRAALKSFICRLVGWNQEQTKTATRNELMPVRTTSLGNQKYPRRSLDPTPPARDPRISLLRRSTDTSIPSRRVNSMHLSPSPSLNPSPDSTLSLKKENDFPSLNVSPNSSELRQQDESLSTNNHSGVQTQMNAPTKISNIELQTYKLTNIVKFADNEVVEGFCHHDSVFVIRVEVNKDTSASSSRDNIVENPVNMDSTT